MANPSFILKQGVPADWGVPSEGKTFLGVNEDGQLVLKQSDGEISVITTNGAASLRKRTNSDGAVIAVTATSSSHKEIVTIAGAARVQVINLAETDLSDGSEVDMLFKLPATSGIILEVYSDATLLWTFTNDTGAAINVLFSSYKDGSGWEPLTSIAPSFTPAT